MHSRRRRGLARAAAVSDQLSGGQRQLLPLFVVGVAFPTCSFDLSVFEPRYRLMIKRCLERSPPVFGVVPPSSSESQLGTLVKIVQSDRAAMDRGNAFQISTEGVSVFRVLRRWRDPAGYWMGTVVTVPEPPVPIGSGAAARELVKEVEAVCESLAEAADSRGLEQLLGWIRQGSGGVPEEALEASWWLGDVLLGSVRDRIQLLAAGGVMARLEMLRGAIGRLARRIELAAVPEAQDDIN